MAAGSCSATMASTAAAGLGSEGPVTSLWPAPSITPRSMVTSDQAKSV